MRNSGPEKFRTLSPPRTVDYAEYSRQLAGVESMWRDIRKKIIEDYRALGYTVTEIGDSIIMEKKDGPS